MKATIGALFFSTSGVVLGSAVLLESAWLAFIAAQGGISADTPITGVTIGLILAAAVAALFAVIRGGRYLIQLGMTLGKWVEALNANMELVGQVQALTKEVAALQRWRESADPILTEWQRRNGVQRQA